MSNRAQKHRLDDFILRNMSLLAVEDEMLVAIRLNQLHNLNGDAGNFMGIEKRMIRQMYILHHSTREKRKAAMNDACHYYEEFRDIASQQVAKPEQTNSANESAEEELGDYMARIHSICENTISSWQSNRGPN